MDDLNGYVIFAGVLLILAVLAYAGYTDLMSRIAKSKIRKSKIRKRNGSHQEKDPVSRHQ